MLTLYNSLTRKHESFVPIIPGKVRMYVCGMTVYDYCHLGHARVFVVFDMISRWLRTSGYEVTYVRNITDIDDKIIKRAAENGESTASLAGRFIVAMHEDEARLGVLPPDHEPRATQYVADMLAMIGSLVDGGLAYRADNGDVYYSVRSFPAYGALSGKSLDDLRAGERVDIDPNKLDPMDFVLWKAAKPGEPAWESPWGPGRPGWHIECSAMGSRLLGAHFDIHGGGQDLQFPHHENEIAQSEGANRCKFVNYWLHNGFVRVDNEKMSKSLGNFFTIREILDKFDPEVVRFFILRAHYRSPLNYSDAHLEDAKGALTRLYTALRNVPPVEIPLDWNNAYAARFRAAMDEDFNTPEAVAVLFDLAGEVNKGKSAELSGLLKALGKVIGLLQRSPEAYLKGEGVGDDERIDRMVKARNEAKSSKNFVEADRIRDELKASGIILEDGPQGTTWRRA
ncbi:MAG: cysteine--tRNA ligase [Hydrogenophilaceae bacterium]|nr:cysteine--tRNA ligase [Hydrogenophilaceae bacterium]